MEYDLKKLVPAVAETLNFYLLLEENGYYNQVASLHGLPRVGNNWVNHPLMRVFEVLDREDASSGRALRTAIVVREDTKKPGDGFYLSLSIRRKIRVVTEAEKEGAYRRERAQAIAYAKASTQTLLGGARAIVNASTYRYSPDRHAANSTSSDASGSMSP